MVNNSGAAASYRDLTPDLILDAVDGLGFRTDGRLLALNSYENRVYQIGIEDAAPLIAKFYRPGRWSDEAIMEEHRFAAELAEAEIPCAPALAGEDGRTLHEHGGFRFALFARLRGRAPELADRATLEWMGRFLARIHVVGSQRAFAARPTIDIASFGEEPREFLLQAHFVPPDLEAAWRSIVDLALDAVRRCFARAGDVASLRLHGDCHAGNVLWTDDGPQFVDFDDSRMGPAVQDLWMLLSGERDDMQRQLGWVLAGYEQFRDFDDRELHLVEALRTLRLIHYSAWIARRWDDPAFPVAFPWFDTPRYWQDRILELREQVALMDEPPLRPA
ncbi:MAG: serine/threonine protein kinase [Rhodocyclaceae bacterium]|jgi:Ser/Thr protein kinase RdoA (MazF antagonist)|nr:MAG: serine/threonine protein kinase [Rhodocyclaceae bacterium]